jgi:hypothetical protein
MQTTILLSFDDDVVIEGLEMEMKEVVEQRKDHIRGTAAIASLGRISRLIGDSADDTFGNN